MKKYIAILSVALVMMAGVFLLSEESDESSALTDGGWTFTVSGSEATLTKFNGSGVTDLVVPSTVSDGSNIYTVTSIQGSSSSNPAVSNRTSLGTNCTLTLPSTLLSIGDYAFMDCSRFTGSLVIPNSVTSIGTSAFYGCSGFTGSLVIPNSVTSIGDRAFQNCTGFTGLLTIPNTVTSIGTYAFSGCYGFTGSLTIPDTLTSIGLSAFNGCSGFTGSLVIPNSVTSIGTYAFRDCTGFTGSLTIPNTVTSIGNYAFQNCTGFTGSLTIPNTVTSIGSSAFQSCSGFTGSLTIPNTVTSIGSSVFRNCTGFTTVVLPDTLSSIGSNAFNGCSNLATIYNASSITLTKGATSNGYVAYYTTTIHTCHTLSIQSNDTSMGTVSDSKIYAVDGTALTIDGANLSTSVPEQHVTATPNTDYTFSGWSDASGAVTSDRTVSAIFMAESVGYVITVLPNNSGYGSVSSASITVAPDSAIVTNGTTLTVDGQSVTASPASATAQYTYAFSGWSPSSGTVTQDMTITANFTRTLNQYTVNISSNDNTFGTVNRSSVTVDYGTAMSVSGRVLTIGSVTVTATPANDTVQYSYSFMNWVGTGPVTGPMSVTAVFARDLQTYTVSITNSTPGWGTTDADALTVDYGTAISADGNVLTVGTDDVVATPESATAQYSYSFGAWSPSSGTVTGDTAITVDFTRSVRSYTMSFQVDKPEYGAWSMDSLTIPYGTAVVADGTSVDVGGTVVEIILTPDSAVSTYKLIGITGLPATVTGDASVTAELGRDNAMDAYNIIQPEYKEGEAKSGIAYDILALLPVFVVIGLLIFAIATLGVFESIWNRY